MMMMIHK